MESTTTNENGTAPRMSRGRIAAWGIATALLIAPLIAMQFTDEVNWTASDFIFAAVLLFGSLGAYEAVARSTANVAYRLGVGVAILAAFLLTWINAAVGITDSEADGLYLVVAALAVLGSLAARFRPRGMAATMVAAAAAQTLVGVGALLAGVVPAHNTPLQILALTGFFALMWLTSAALLREAALGRAPRDPA